MPFEKSYRIKLHALVSSLIALFSATNSKVDAGRQGHHAILVAKVTKRLEKLIEKGDYAQSRVLLKDFNKDYEIVSKNLGDLEVFVNKLLQDRNIPANQSLERDGSYIRRPSSVTFNAQMDRIRQSSMVLLVRLMFNATYKVKYTT